MRFLHTADWQIGMKAGQAGQKAEEVRSERISAARRVVEAAGNNHAEFILIAGDVFEDNGVDRESVSTVASILGETGMPVYVIPGNHDPLCPGSVWDSPAWRTAPNVRILREEKPEILAGGLLYPCPVREKHSDRNPTAWIRADRSQGICIGLVHGSIEGYGITDLEYPIPQDAPNRTGLDYVALGHWHGCTPKAGEGAALRMAYSGTHETASFGEKDSGYSLLVEIEAPGAVPSVTGIRTGRLRWVKMETKITQPGDIGKLTDEIAGIADAADTLLSLSLSGLLSAGDRVFVDRLRILLRDRFFLGILDDSMLRPAPDDAAWIDSMPEGILSRAAERLRQMADPGFTGPRPEGFSTQAAASALIELYGIISEIRA